jgi:hypothetical protein
MMTDKMNKTSEGELMVWTMITSYLLLVELAIRVQMQNFGRFCDNIDKVANRLNLPTSDDKAATSDACRVSVGYS